MSPAARPLRVDAARNRALLLEAAEAEFVDRGLEASVADIARRAGVAKGTVFRHFATKDDLIAAIVAEHLSALTEAATSRLTAVDTGDALFEFLGIAADARRQDDLVFLQTVSQEHSRVVEVRDELYAAVTALVDRAREAHAVRSDITGADVILLLCAPVHAVEFAPNPSDDLWRRYLTIVFDGLRPQGASPLPVPPPVLS
jgi:AcrR family transcriptional regulator